MISIDQLLESVDLDFEPRFVTKSNNDRIDIFDAKPESTKDGIWWIHDTKHNFVGFHYLKLSEFANKNWTECIYEVPRKTTGKIEKLERHIRVENGYEISCPPDESEIIEKINLLIDAVNELKGGEE